MSKLWGGRCEHRGVCTRSVSIRRPAHTMRSLHRACGGNHTHVPISLDCRFTGKVDPIMERFNLSLDIDKVMWAADIDGSVAYSKALEKAKVISATEGSSIRSGLEKVRAEWAAGTFEPKEGDEDIHTANERRLTELVGAVGGKVHTGRSRNDQVVTDLRLHLRGLCARLLGMVHSLVLVAAKRARAEAHILMPGYTHLQSAQPIRWGHWMLAHASSWRRDGERLAQFAERINELPLGSGALAGNPFGIDRETLAADLGFARPMANSIDGVTDRDFVIELSMWASLLMVSTHPKHPKHTKHTRQPLPDTRKASPPHPKAFASHTSPAHSPTHGGRTHRSLQAFPCSLACHTRALRGTALHARPRPPKACSF